MPTEDSVGGDNSREFRELLPAQRLAFDCQHTSLVIGEDTTLLSLSLERRLHLRLIEVDDLLLLPLEPAGQTHQQQLPRMQNWLRRHASVPEIVLTSSSSLQPSTSRSAGMNDLSSQLSRLTACT